MSRISPLLPGLSMLSPGKMRSSIGAQSARTPSTASRPSSPPAPLPPSRTSACRSGYIPTPPLQASEQSSHKYGKARSALFAVPCTPSTRRRKIPRHETGVPRHRLGCCQIPPLPDVDVIRSLYRPLRAAVAQDDAHTIRPPSSMVSRAGRVQFHRKAPAREVPNPRRWTKPLTCQSPTSRRRYPANMATGG